MYGVHPDLHPDILVRLPVESLLRFRAVCKDWRRTIDGPAFVRSYLDAQFSSAAALIVRNHKGTRLYSVSLDSDSYFLGTRTIETTPLKASDHLQEMPFLPVASCDGLILVVSSGKVLGIWNPFRREYRELPRCKIFNPRGTFVFGCLLNVGPYFCCGFGYDCGGDDYKVVKIDQLLNHRERTTEKCFFVYSLKMNSWRRIEQCPLSVHWFVGYGVYFNNALHWICTVLSEDKELQHIVAFDLGTEDYRLLPLPREVSNPDERFQRQLDVLGGCFLLSCTNSQKSLDGWIMNGYGDTNSWNKLFSFTQLDIIGAVGNLKPLAYLRSEGQVLFEHFGEEFFLFDFEKKTSKKIIVHGFPDSFSSQICPASLVRLNSAAVADGNTSAEERTRQRLEWTNDRCGSTSGRYVPISRSRCPLLTPFVILILFCTVDHLLLIFRVMGVILM